MSGNRNARGFSLLENLVALAIVAVALSAALRAGAQAVDTSEGLAARTLARWVAQNRLAELRALPGLPALGTSTGEAQQGHQHFRWEQRVSTTADARWRTVALTVFDEDGHVRARLDGHVLAHP